MREQYHWFSKTGIISANFERDRRIVIPRRADWISVRDMTASEDQEPEGRLTGNIGCAVANVIHGMWERKRIEWFSASRRGLNRGD